MANQHHTAIQSKNGLLGDLAAARDLARLEAHLLSMEARQQWRELETRLDHWEQRLDHSGDRVTERVGLAVRDLTHAVGDFFREQEQRCPELEVPVSSLMTQGVRTCAPKDSLSSAAQIMWDCDCGVVPVVSEKGHVMGVVTDRDITMACYTRGVPLSGATVESAMSKTVYSCMPNQTVRQALRTMSQAQVRRLPVISDAGELVGMLSLIDVARRASPSARALGTIATTLSAIGKRRYRGTVSMTD